jgi:hypothetical protein
MHQHSLIWGNLCMSTVSVWLRCSDDSYATVLALRSGSLLTNRYLVAGTPMMQAVPLHLFLVTFEVGWCLVN